MFASGKAKLYTRLLLLVLSLLIVSSSATLIAVITATDNNIEREANARLQVGSSVLESMLENQGKQLLESARVLTADFGFKQAVALRDKATIESVLENHGARINADLISLFDLSGELLASTTSFKSEAHTELIQKMLADDAAATGVQTTTTLEDKAYQLVMVQVRAPAPVAWAVIAYEIDKAFAQNLKQMTLLDVSFAQKNQRSLLVTTLPDVHSRQLQTLSTMDESEYSHLPTVLSNGLDLKVILSVSLAEERARFNQLKLQILLISAVILIGCLMVMIPMLRGITKPIGKLVHGAQRIASGDYTAPIELVRAGGSEITVLADSFNQMQSAVASREKQIVYQAHHDALTKLPVRDKIAIDLQQLINCDNTNEVAIVSISVQRIKSINNSLGFAVGDKLLCACAARWQQLFPAPHVIGRSTASEFILLYVLSEKESLEQVADNLHQAWSEPFEVSGFEINVPLTLGFARSPENGLLAEELLRRSDMALNRALELRHQSEYYEQGEDQKHLKQIRLINDLKQAMQADQLTLYYQPKINVAKRGVTEVEALVRWIHPELGFIPPDEFIGLAEQSGLMPALSRWILTRGIRDASAWQSVGHDVSVAINLSAYDLMHDDLPVFLDTLLSNSEYSSSRLILEVTESAMMEDPDKALSVLNRFKSQGFTLAIDDYGTGYSSLGQMKQLPVDELKIDMCFVRKLSTDSSDQVIVKSTIAMAHNIGLKVVAEGVEDAEAQALLEQWGCDKLQGFYFSKPLPYEDFLLWMGSFEFKSAFVQGRTKGEENSLSGSADAEQRRAS
ncbi:MAG: putative bifunctional diguanylate cyclase/phosphodiesterase [Pseudomonadales bacterium]